MADNQDNPTSTQVPAGDDTPAGHAAIPLVRLALEPGTIIGGAYKIIKVIGLGGMGQVYLARHETLGKKCALKIIPADQVTEVGWQRFLREAKAIAKLDHVNLVRVTDLGKHENCLPFYAMDFVDGKNLEVLLAESGSMPLAVVLDIFMQVCDGLDCAHRNGMLHRDIKPANILVTTTGSGKRVAKILDFGLVKLIGDNRAKQSLTATGDLFGTPSYMSPEQLSYQEIDERSDIYSVGCTMFECLTGRPPFVGNLQEAVLYGHMEGKPPTLESIAGKDMFPPSLETVIKKLLRKKPEERYQTLMELRHDLEKISSGDVSKISSARPTLVEPHLALGHETTADPPANQPEHSSLTAPGPAIEIPPAGSSTDGKMKDPSAHPRAGASASGLTSRKALACLLLAAGLAFAGTYYLKFMPRAKLSSAIPSSAPTNKVFAQPTVETKAPATKTQVAEGQTTQAKTAPLLVLPLHQIVTASLMLPKPFSTIVKEGNIEYRCFDFPSDVVIGLIATDKHEQPVKATGHIRYLATEGVRFVPAEIVARYPNCLSRFRPGEVTVVKFTPDTGEKMFKAISNLQGVIVLDFGMCHNIRPEWVAPLAVFKHVCVYLGSDNNLEGPVLARAGALNELTECYLTSTKNAIPIVQALQACPKLRRLGLWGHVNHNEMQAVAGLKQLTKLDINGDRIQKADLAALTALPGLTDLSLKWTGIGAESIDLLKQFKSLKVLQIKTEEIPDNDLEKIKKALPAVTVL